VINRSERPVVAVNGSHTSTAVMALALRLERHVTIRALWHEAVPREMRGFTDVFVYDPMGWSGRVLSAAGFQRLPELGPRLLWWRPGAATGGD
jgi:hypothetical protein